MVNLLCGARNHLGLEAVLLLIEDHRLPGYSPELNPAELLNNDTKRAALTRKRPRHPEELLDGTEATSIAAKNDPT